MLQNKSHGLRGGSLAGGGVNDHGDLDGLADDDHTIYVLATGARAITGAQNFAAGSTNGLTIGAGSAIYKITTPVSGEFGIDNNGTYILRYDGTMFLRGSTVRSNADLGGNLGSAAIRWTRIFLGVGSETAPSVNVGADGNGLFGAVGEVRVSVSSVTRCRWDVAGMFPGATGYDLGIDVQRWGHFYTDEGHFQNLPAVKTASATLTTSERNSIWDGTSLTATLPANPSNGCLISIKNLNSTALTVAAATGDTLNDGSSLAQNATNTYIFLSSSRVWYVMG